uniref:Transmembrane protein n=1 Tax=Neospora caninum (strain Liverpool) TaxID=572307 RepID=F0JAY8_NEOCL|nr:hypothetical protein, conserved [Neospora caninum Liverpool]CEL71254.1 TPA: hypothetical protein, conserved [Neospora caninum Liverpool]
MATTGSAQEDERVVASPASDCSSACPTPAASEVRRRRGERQETEAQGWSQRAQDEPAGDDTKKSAQDGAGLAAAFQARQFPPLPGTESVDWPRGDFLLACLLCVAGAIFVVAGWRMWTTQGAWEAFPAPARECALLDAAAGFEGEHPEAVRQLVAVSPFLFENPHFVRPFQQVVSSALPSDSIRFAPVLYWRSRSFGPTPSVYRQQGGGGGGLAEAALDRATRSFRGGLPRLPPPAFPERLEDAVDEMGATAGRLFSEGLPRAS